MLYSRLLAPWLLWLVLMLTNTAVRNSSTEQCLGLSSPPKHHQQCETLNNAKATKICKDRSAEIFRSNVSLPYCGRLVHTTLPGLPEPHEDCEKVITGLMEADTEARRLSENFRRILDRFDCPQPYSVKFTCAECQVAYRNWICSDKFVYWHKGRKFKPCRSNCQRVEQTCPFFLPLDKGPAHYAGEPTFLCLDPNIEETGEQLAASSYGPDACCYDECENGLCTIRDGGCPLEDPSESAGSGGPSQRIPAAARLRAVVLLFACLFVNRTRLII